MPDGWRTDQLGRFIELKRGYDLPKQDRHDGEVPVVSSSGVSGFHSEAKADGPGVVTGRYGTIGQVHFIEGPYWPLNTTLYVRDFKGNDPRFVAYFLMRFDYMAHSDKSSVPGVNRNHLHATTVTLPPLQEQRAIAAVLGALDDKIELNRRMNETLEEMARLEFAELSRAAQPVLAGVVFDIHRETVKPQADPDGLYLHFSLPAFDAGAPTSEPGSAIKSNKQAVPADAILLSKLNPRIPRVWWADTESGEGTPVASTEFLVCRARRPYGRATLYSLLVSDGFQRMLSSLVTGSTGSHQRVQPTAVPLIEVQIPSVDDGIAFEQRCALYLDRVQQNKRENRTLAELRDTLLPKLLSGEIRVRQAEKILEDAT